MEASQVRKQDDTCTASHLEHADSTLLGEALIEMIAQDRVVP